MVDSEVGKGTTFRILWPSVAGDGEFSAAPDDVEIPPPTKGTVLVAEDEEGARTLIRTILEREGYLVVGVADGQEALEVVTDMFRKIDLLLTDIVMPGMSGLELAEQVRDLRPGLPILFMSGYVDAHPQNLESSPGSLNLLAKPFRPAELRKRVKEVLERR